MSLEVHTRSIGARPWMRSAVRSVLHEPLFQFLLIAVAIFAVHGLFSQTSRQTPEKIVVTAPKIEQMANLFAKTWQRPPNSEELKGLIDDYVKEEILVRQALELGLDENDAVVRRRLRQKMEFLHVAAAEAHQPTEADLQDYLASHAEDFWLDAKLAFQQVFLSPQRRGDAIVRDAAATLEVLLTNPDADRTQLGDPTLLPPELALSDRQSIAQTFGGDFAEALDKAPIGQWTGPAVSGFGMHLIRVTERQAGRTPVLEEIRDSVNREWLNFRRKQFDDQRIEDLLKGYSVTIEDHVVEGPAH